MTKRKLILLSICYVVIYFLFGYIIAWNLPELRQYYATVSNSAVMHQIESEAYQQSGIIANLKAYFIDSDPFIIPFQLFRGLLWTLIAIPVIKMLNANSKTMPLVIGFLYSIMFATLLLIPNAYMPHNVRIVHLYETVSSNFLYGIIVALLIMYVPQKRKSKSYTHEIKRIVNSDLVENM